MKNNLYRSSKTEIKNCMRQKLKLLMTLSLIFTYVDFTAMLLFRNKALGQFNFEFFFTVDCGHTLTLPKVIKDCSMLQVDDKW